MRLLLDECVPRPLKRELAGHDVSTVVERGWSSKRNAELLRPTRTPSLRPTSTPYQITVMTPKALRDEVLRLPPQERLKLLEDIWDSLTPEDIPIPDWHKEELDRRLDDPASGPGLTWEEVRAKLNDRKRS